MRRRIRRLLLKIFVFVVVLSVIGTLFFTNLDIKKNQKEIPLIVPEKNDVKSISYKTLDEDPLDTKDYTKLGLKIIPGKIILGDNCSVIVMSTPTSQSYLIQRFVNKSIEDRPNSGDLMTDVISNFDIDVLMVKIYDIKDNSYISDLLLRDKQKKKILSLDAKPSDAIAIASWFNAPIYVKKDLFEQNKEEIC